jgi:hypothetical protein
MADYRFDFELYLFFAQLMYNIAWQKVFPLKFPSWKQTSTYEQFCYPIRITEFMNFAHRLVVWTEHSVWERGSVSVKWKVGRERRNHSIMFHMGYYAMNEVQKPSKPKWNIFRKFRIVSTSSKNIIVNIKAKSNQSYKTFFKRICCFRTELQRCVMLQ